MGNFIGKPFTQVAGKPHCQVLELQAEDEISSSEAGVVQCCKAQEGKHSRWQRLQRNYQGPWQTTRTKAEITEVEEPG